jgi:hypothetical protein
LTDAQVEFEFGVPRAEWYRWVSDMEEPQTSVLTRKAGSYKYAEGPFPANTAVNFDIPQPQTEKELLYIWKNVPRAGLKSNGGIGPPTNLDLMLNTVNANPFLGYKAGVLWFKTYKLVEVESGIDPGFFTDLYYSPGLLYDVHLTFGWRDPQTTFDGNYGWNLFPGPQGNPNYYLATTDGTGTGGTLLQPADFRTIFKLQP